MLLGFAMWLRGALLVGLAGLLAGCGTAPPPPSAGPTTYTPAQVARRAHASVVKVVTPHGFGSGFVVGKDRIATNLHVVDSSASIEVVFFDGSKRKATGIWLPETKRDLAMLAVETGDLRPLPLADAGRLHPGDHVVAVGNPRGYDHTVSDGIVSALRAESEISYAGGSMLQHSAPVAPGSSGGPLFDDLGEVVGVNTLAGKDIGNLNFAVPANEVAELARTTKAPLTLEAFAASAGANARCSVAPANLAACLAQCEAGRADGCSDAGVLVRRGVGTPRDDRRAAELYRRACDGGNAIGCTNLASLHERGEGVPKDLTRARALYRDACDRGERGACANLALLVKEDGPGGPARALQLFDLACDAKFKEACRDGAAFAESSKGGRRFERAASFHQRACDHGVGGSCGRLGQLLAEGRGVSRDVERAARLFERGCRLDDAGSCADFGLALVHGRGIAKDRERGLSELRWACAHGAGASCREVASLEKRASL